MDKLFSLYFRVRKKYWLSTFVIWMRYLIAFAFVPSGLTKLLGERFTVLPISNPVGLFFEAMYQTGLYWRFLGLMQLLTAFLLMTQRFATIGNLLFLSISINIFLITYSMHFEGTVYITFLLVIASIGLFLWDLPKWVPLMAKDNFEHNSTISNLPTYQPIHVTAGVIFFLESILFGWLPKLLNMKTITVMLIMVAIIFLTAIIVFVFSLRKKRG